jgi:hypothetical protein
MTTGGRAGRGLLDQGANRRRTARARQREHGNTGTKAARRARNADPPNRTHSCGPASQPTDDTLTRVAPEQQRHHQQPSRRQLERDARASDNDDGDREGHDRKQPEREVRTRAMSSHAGNIQPATPQVQTHDDTPQGTVDERRDSRLRR